ncbi:MAG: murein biosynthesis integral membrane protein MurJ [Omnitrophica WOR_2 bacterium RIFCSPHIGHO2_02_FULL_46_37]|nr:MAG: murein biosynthesis integral membrane protein MurJ [Omnitrophica WOR_2 bacterium RIFCSPHIGHO2_02_FULL_46_37]
MSTNKAIARSAFGIGFFTLCSRILGFIRDIVIARLFGVYVYAQAFVIAFRIPNLLRDLLGEGAANAALVPVFSEYSLKASKEEFWKLCNVVLNLLLVIVSAIVVFGVFFSPSIVRLIAPGFMFSPEKLEITIRLNRIIFPYLLLISLSAYCLAVLNSLKAFALPAFAPCLLNISLIVFVLLCGEGITGLALGVLVGGILQLAVQVPVLYQKGFRLRVFQSFKHPQAVTIGKLMLPRVFSSGIYQLNNFVDSIFGSLSWIVGEGGVAVLYFSYRMIQFPLGIFSNALAQAILPAFSTQAADDTYAQLRQTLFWGLRTTFFVMLPASIGFMVLALPIVSILFGGGKFDIYSVERTASALIFYSIGLFAYSATKMLQNAFFALRDTVTPAKIAFLALLINIILNFILMSPLKIGGIALATSISSIGTFFILLLILKKRLGDFDTKKLIASFARILLASLSMGAVCYFTKNRILSAGGLNKYLGLALVIIAGALSYIIFCFILRVSEMRELWRWLMKKKRRVSR